MVHCFFTVTYVHVAPFSGKKSTCAAISYSLDGIGCHVGDTRRIIANDVENVLFGSGMKTIPKPL